MKVYLHLCAATIQLEELLLFKSPLILPFFSIVFKEIYVKNVRG